MKGWLQRAQRLGAMMVGMPDYDAYLRHMREHHPGEPAMGRTAFFRDRQEARYGGRNGGKCC